MNDAQREKVKRFVNDEVMQTAVKEVIQRAFLKARPEKDVHYLAAKSLSIEFLEDAWRELQRYKTDEGEEPKVTAQIGL